MPMMGMPFRCARSMTLITFSAKTSPSEPPKTEESWLKSITSPPSLLAMPRHPLLLEAETGGAMRREDVELLERVAVDEASDPLPRRELALRMLAVEGVGIAVSRLVLALAQLVERIDLPKLGVRFHSGSLARLVLAEHSAQDRAALADSHVVGQRRLERDHQVVLAARSEIDIGQVAVDDRLRAASSQSLERPRLRDLVTWTDLHDLDGFRASLLIAVDADHHSLARLDPPLHPVGAVRDAALRPAALDACHGAAELVHLGHDRLCFLFDPVGETLDVVRPSERIRHQRDSGLVTDDLLRAQGKCRSALRGKAQRLVVTVCMQ